MGFNRSWWNHGQFLPDVKHAAFGIREFPSSAGCGCSTAVSQWALPWEGSKRLCQWHPQFGPSHPPQGQGGLEFESKEWLSDYQKKDEQLSNWVTLTLSKVEICGNAIVLSSRTPLCAFVPEIGGASTWLCLCDQMWRDSANKKSQGLQDSISSQNK